MMFLLIIFTITNLVMCELSLLLLHTNDMHARFEQVDRHLRTCKSNDTLSCYGGFARLHAMVKKCKMQAEADGRFTLFLNAGDTFQGTPYYTEYKWQLVAKMIDALDIDVMALGNHEFDDGVESLAAYIGQVKVPIVCSNIDRSKDPSLQHPNLASSKVLIVNGTKVGVIGYLTTSVSSEGKDCIDNLKILEEIPSIREEAQKLRRQSVKIIIALGHSGYDKDIEIAKKVEDIDVVVGGHSHTFLFTGTPPDLEEPSGPYPTMVTQESGKRVPVVQAFFGTKYLGYLELDFDNEGNLKSCNGTPIFLMGLFPESSDVLRELNPYKVALEIKTNRIIGYTRVLLDNDNFKCKVSECELGNMIADAFVEYMVHHCPSVPVSAGFLNGGGIREPIDVISDGQNGSITEGDIMTVLPWGKPVVVLSLPGRVILEMLEHSIHRFKDTKAAYVNHFLQVSGLNVTYNLDGEGGQHVTHVKVLCTKCEEPWMKPLSQEEVYGVVLPEYLANGGDGFSMLTNYKKLCISEDGDYTIVSQYIQNHTPVNPHIEDRIKIEHRGIKDIVLPIGVCILIALLILFIFRDAISQPKYLCLWSHRVTSTTSAAANNYEYEKLLSTQAFYHKARD